MGRVGDRFDAGGIRGKMAGRTAREGCLDLVGRAHRIGEIAGPHADGEQDAQETPLPEPFEPDTRVIAVSDPSCSSVAKTALIDETPWLDLTGLGFPAGSCLAGYHGSDDSWRGLFLLVRGGGPSCREWRDTGGAHSRPRPPPRPESHDGDFTIFTGGTSRLGTTAVAILQDG